MDRATKQEKSFKGNGNRKVNYIQKGQLYLEYERVEISWKHYREEDFEHLTVTGHTEGENETKKNSI